MRNTNMHESRAIFTKACVGFVVILPDSCRFEFLFNASHGGAEPGTVVSKISGERENR